MYRYFCSETEVHSHRWKGNQAGEEVMQLQACVNSLSLFSVFRPSNQGSSSNQGHRPGI